MREYTRSLISEEQSLRSRIARLARFVNRYSSEIPADELLLLGDQLNHMVCYDKILLKRIDMHLIRG